MEQAEKDSSEPAPLQWLALAVVIVPVLLILREVVFGPDFFTITVAIPALLLFWAVSGIASGIAVPLYLWARSWRRAAMSAGLAAIVGTAAFVPINVVGYCNDVGTWVHFTMFYPYYRTQLPAKSREPRLVIFNRGGMVWASFGYVYDESDEIMLSPARQSEPWKKRADGTELGCGYGAKPLWDHFYSASFSC